MCSTRPGTHSEDVLSGRIFLLQSLQHGDDGAGRLLLVNGPLEVHDMLAQLLLIHLGGCSARSSKRRGIWENSDG